MNLIYQNISNLHYTKVNVWNNKALCWVNMYERRILYNSKQIIWTVGLNCENECVAIIKGFFFLLEGISGCNKVWLVEFKRRAEELRFASTCFGVADTSVHAYQINYENEVKHEHVWVDWLWVCIYICIQKRLFVSMVFLLFFKCEIHFINLSYIHAHLRTWPCPHVHAQPLTPQLGTQL